MTGYRDLRRVLTPVLTCLALASCVTEMKVSAMHPANGTLVAQPPPGMASIVFVRPFSSCDTAGYPTVVDENGRFLGNAGPNTTFVVNVPAGRHAFYAWDYIDERRATSS
jgi:hypothetical protein